MGKKAFGLMVAAHANIFRRIARYDGRWYLSNLYIKKLKEKEGFSIVRAKYELMAKRHTYSLKPGGGEGQEVPVINKQSSGTIVAQDYQDIQGSVYHLMAPEAPLAKEYYDKPPYPKTHALGKKNTSCTLSADGAGNPGPASVWPPLLTVGEYDMVFDANQDGT